MPILLSENFRALFYAPFYAALATGAFRDAGVQVELRASPEPAAATRALRDGSVDVMWGGPLRVMMTHDADPHADTVAFADVVARDPFFIVGAAPRPSFTFADLAEIPLGVVSEVPTPWLCLQEDLRRAGVVVRHPVRGRSMADNAAALRDGTLAAIQVFQPHVEDLLADGAGHVWYAAASRGPAAYTALVTRQPTLQSRRDELRAMTVALHRTLGDFAIAPAAEIVAAVRGYFPDLPPDLFARAIARYQELGLWNDTPVIRRDGYEFLHTAMRNGGALSRDIAFESCIDTTLAEEAIMGLADSAPRAGVDTRSN